MPGANNLISRGLWAEFGSEENLRKGVSRLEALGVVDCRVYSPVSTPLVSSSASAREAGSDLGFWALAFGLLGAALAFGFQRWASVYGFAMNIGAKPADSWPSFVPVSFEAAVLFAATAVFLRFMKEARLPRLNHPVFDYPGIERVTIDRYFVWVGTSGGVAQREKIMKLLRESGALRVSEVSDARG